MIFEYEDKGKVKVNMSSYIKNMLEDFPVKLKKSQTAATPAGEGLYNLGQGRKLNKEDAEAELVGADDVATQILWTKHFMEAQGYMIKDNILHQDNKSTILLQENGRKSAGKRSRALNVRYFFLRTKSRKGT